ncbi:acyl-CoA dehydrogenase family protein [Pseudomonas putida]|uniref:acyl-CoA dehydrogenase family protein n=1 Tax=Pseudomonas putida TaxID=303 RepID=UPI002366A4C0|nr:acyl-CoA dehydrogenase family protein [Pseudomonas putida]MDD2050606.1 acyl-CoA dehydrogenase family protein [Pseudomonas putida]
MNFSLDYEQQMLQDSVRRFIDKDYPFQARSAQVQTGLAGSAAHWPTFAANGWLCAALPEAFGGLGGSIIDTVLIAHEFGRGLVLEPFVGSAVLAAQTLVAAATPAQLDQWVPALADGSRRLALAYSEVQSRGLPQPVQLRADAVDGGYRLHGVKTLVLGGADAAVLIVSALTAQGVSLFLVDAASSGLSRQALPLHDGSWAAQVQLDNVWVSSDALLGAPGSGLTALQHGLAHATAALCAELVGVMEKAIELTADYLKIREQFGMPIGRFQALQHRIADMAADLEMARSMLMALLDSINNDHADERQLRISQAKALIGRTAKSVCAQAIQLHGGIGTSEECSIGHYYKRAVVADLLLGHSDRHEALCADYLQATLQPGDRTA